MRLDAPRVPIQIRRLFLSWGVDRAVAYTLLGRGWSVLAGPVTLLFLAAFLSPEEQGFYYTFASILALQVFFELGLSYVILQFASHEKASLEWNRHGALTGDPMAKSRLSSLLRISLTWYGVVSALVVLAVLPSGLIFFGAHKSSGAEVVWQLPWAWTVLVTAGTLSVTPIFAVLEGTGLVAEVAFVRACQNILGSLLLWLALSQHWGLYATPLFVTVGFVWGLGWLLLKKRHFILDLLRSHSTLSEAKGDENRGDKASKISWWGEVWPFQWKIAISWVSGYFIFQLFNPVLFALFGPVPAGQMGMSISIITSISTVAIAWVDTKAAPFGGLIAKREFNRLDRVFFPCLRQSIAVLAFGGLLFWSVAFYLHAIHYPLSLRVLDPLPLGLLVGTAIINHIVFAQAVYLRAHKQEPFLAMSVAIACLVGLSTYFLGKAYGATGMMTGYFVINLVLGLGVGTLIFTRKRHLWHFEPSDG